MKNYKNLICRIKILMRMQKDYSTLTEAKLWELFSQDQECKPAFDELYERYASGVCLAALKFVPSEDLVIKHLVLIFLEVWHKRKELAAIQDFDFGAYLSDKVKVAIFDDAKMKIIKDLKEGTDPQESP